MHAEMFNNLSHKGNSNQNDTEITSHSIQNGCPQENKKSTNIEEDSGKVHTEILPHTC
jgi:hypothetical protein